MPVEPSTWSAFVQWADHWQTLLGSLLGGVFALLVAFIVAHAQTRREQRAAAAILLVDILAVMAADRSLTNLTKEQNVSDERLPLWLAEKLGWRRPKLSSLFELEMVRLIDIHASMAAHLSVFKMQYSALEEPLARLAEDQKVLMSADVALVPRSPEASNADVQSISGYFRSAADHAECAAHFLDALVLSSIPTFAKLRMMCWRTDIEKKSKGLLASSGI
jgi:hypothetical protein